jgi:sortase A
MKKSRRTRGRVRRWIGACLMLIGVGAIGVWIWSKASETVYQNWSSGVFDRQIHTEHAPAERPAPIGANALVGRLTIPRLHMDAMVREGSSEATLRLALGHIEGTALPGHGGNVGVAGHRDTLFRELRKIEKNDLIQFETLAGNYVYQVEGTEIVKPQDVDVLKASLYPELTLITCYPFYYVGSAPDRFIVKARQVSTNLQTPPPQALAALPEPVPSPPRKSLRSQSPITRTVSFEVNEGHSRELAPGISFGLSSADAAGHLVNGWMWLMPDRRTIWLRNQSIDQPIVFYSGYDGRRRELRITRVTRGGVAGYLLLFHESPASVAAHTSPAGE